MRKVMARLLPLLLLFCFHLHSAKAQQATHPPSLALGDAVVTGFSGTIAPDATKPRPPNRSAIDLTFINPDGPSARIIGLGQPGFVWDGRVFAAPKPFDVLAKDVGQVFGVALDDGASPNIYLAATSAFGLQLVSPGANGQPERRKVGGPAAGWMKGQFGLNLQGDPGSIYKVDGTTGVVTLFAKVMLSGVPNPGTGLGNLAYDAAHKQLFASDLYTGMIHRFAIADGSEGGPPYDHGVTGRGAAHLSPVPFDPGNRPNIASSKFDSQDPDTWGFAKPERRVWAVMVHNGRLFYSARNGAAADGPQIWSVGIQQDGSLAADARLEVDVPAQPGPYPISDIAFSQDGAMILAQRAPIAASYDYSAFTKPGQPRVLRYSPAASNDPNAPGGWVAVPGEYAVGFPDDYRKSNGGVDLGYGYDHDGHIDTKSCDSAIWITGENLRNDPALRDRLLPGGPLVVHGIQGSDAHAVRDANAPPWMSYFVAYDDRFSDPNFHGHLGVVRINRVACGGGPVVVSGGSAGPSAGTGGGGGGGGGGNRGGGGGGPVYDLAIAKTGVASTTAGGGFTFTLAVTNPGAAISNAAAIQVKDVVPAGMTFTGVAAGPDWSCLPVPPIAAGATLTCTYAGTGPIASGAALPSIAITAAAPLGGSFQNCSTVGFTTASGLQDSNPSNNTSCATVTNPIDLGIVKGGGAIGGGPVGGTTGLEFDLTITNVGLGFTAANNVTVTDVVPAVPAGTTYSLLSATPAGYWSCPTTAVTAGNSFTCTYTGPSPVLAGAAMGMIAISATPPPPQGQTMTNCAAVAVTAASGLQDSNPSNNSACITLNSQGNVPVSQPPALPTACGFNTLFILDRSGSMGQLPGGGSEVPTVQSILTTAASLFNQNGSQTAEIMFSNTASLTLYPMANSNYAPLPGSYPGAGYPYGQTNWAAAFQLAASKTWPKTTVAFFITDGMPNEYLDAGGNLVSTPNTTLGFQTAASYAVPYVNQLYGAGIPVIGIGLTGAANEPVTSSAMTTLLGPNNVTMTSYAGLASVFAGIAHTLCPGLSLTKSFSTQYFDYNGLTQAQVAALKESITLTLTNFSGATQNPVLVHDDLPPQLTLPVGFVPTFTPGVPAVGGQTAGPGTKLGGSGGELAWTINNLPVGSAPSVTFPVQLPWPGPQLNSCMTINNYAQVTAISGVAEANYGSPPPALMANPITGPVHEPDEATAYIVICNSPPAPPEYCTQAELFVTKVYNSSVEACQPGLPCGPFTVTVTPVCTNWSQTGPGIKGFTGPVEFGEGVYHVTNQTDPPSSGTLDTATGLSFTSTMTGPCATNTTWTPPTSTASDCGPVNVNLTFGSTITFSSIMINAPTWTTYPANFLNCFIADGTTSTPPASYAGAFNDANSWPQNNPLKTWGGTPQPWGNCAPFQVAPPTDRPLRVCPPPMIPGPTRGLCVCPDGMKRQGNECVIVQKQCPPPMIPGPTPGSCVCPPPMVPGAAPGTCVCPDGMQLQGKRCVKPIDCKPPLIPDAAGRACMCPKGLVRKGQDCVRPIECKPPMKPNAAGTACVCPRDTVQRGQDCVPVERGGRPGRGGGGGGGRR